MKNQLKKFLWMRGLLPHYCGKERIMYVKSLDGKQHLTEIPEQFKSIKIIFQ